MSFVPRRLFLGSFIKRKTVFAMSRGIAVLGDAFNCRCTEATNSAINSSSSEKKTLLSLDVPHSSRLSSAESHCVLSFLAAHTCLFAADLTPAPPPTQSFQDGDRCISITALPHDRSSEMVDKTRPFWQSFRFQFLGDESREWSLLEKHIFVTFPSTKFSQLADLMVDFNIKIIKPVGGVKVHKGFHTRGEATITSQSQKSKQSLVAYLQQCLNEGYQVVLTGHSLGGATAVQVALALAKEGCDQGVSVFTFAAPVGTCEEASHALKGINNRLWQFVQNQDCIPCLPRALSVQSSFPFVRAGKFSELYPLGTWIWICRAWVKERSGCRQISLITRDEAVQLPRLRYYKWLSHFTIFSSVFGFILSSLFKTMGHQFKDHYFDFISDWFQQMYCNADLSGKKRIYVDIYPKR